MRTNLIVMTMGYVESSHVATLFFDNHGPPFERGIDALQNLAEGFVQKYEDELRERCRAFRDCCKKAQLETNDLFCATCGSRILAEFDLEQFRSWLFGLNGATTDEWGGEFGPSCQWWPWPTLEEMLRHPRHEILVFDEHGEDTIIKGLRGHETDLPGYKEAIDNFWKDYQARLNDWDREHGRTHTRKQFAEYLDKYKPKSEDNYRIAAAPDT